MATLKDFRDERLRKLAELKELGINPYPAKSQRTHSIADVVEGFEHLEGQEVTIVGRIMSIRKFGKLAFIVMRDMSGQVQLFIKKGEGSLEADRSNSELLMPEEIALLDTGDFVQCNGQVIKTQTGEISVSCMKLRLLTKSLRPMPSAQEGFTDKEQRLRRRYVDMNVNIDVRDRFVRRSKFWQATRDFLNNEGFLEVNIPVLEHTTGGADANPFVTHMDALDQDFYLRISHELPLKRLIGAGFEKVYDLGPRFRNENYSDEHLPEHIAMEWYWAYADWEDGMKLTQSMVRHIADMTWGTRQFKLANGMEIDLGTDNEDWPRVSFVELLKEKYGIDVYTCTLDEAVKKLKEAGGIVEKIENRSRVIDKLWKLERVKITGPTFLIDVPDFLQPLAKLQQDDNRLTDQFNLMLGGSEVCKAYSELNDPVDQLSRFVDQQSMREAGDEEAMMMDIDFVEMLEYGMPPACGYGNSERLFWMLEGVTAREGVVFPQLRSDVDEVTKSIYPELFSAEAIKAAQTIREQDFSKRIINVVRKDLEPWRVANAVAHMQTIIGSKTDEHQLTSADNFIDSRGDAIPRNSQFPIIIMKGDEKSLHKLYKKITENNLTHHVFIKEMQDTTNDNEIVESLKSKSFDDTEFYGVSFFADNDIAKKLTKDFQVWK